MICTHCTKAGKRPGRHRAHACARGIGTLWCNCPCNQPSRHFEPPSMALDWTPPPVIMWTFE